MRKLRCRGPGRKLNALVKIVRGDEFYSGPLRSFARALCEKNRTVIGAAQELSQRELLIRNAAFPVFPKFRRTAHKLIWRIVILFQAGRLSLLEITGKSEFRRGHSSPRLCNKRA